MSMTQAKKYFVDLMRENKYELWKDGFNFENIPSTLIHRAFHVMLGDFSGRKPVNNRDQEIDCPCTVRFFLKGYKHPEEAIDAGVEQAEKMTVVFLKNRLGSCVKNVILNSINVSPYSANNDNLVMVTMNFTVFTSIKVHD